MNTPESIYGAAGVSVLASGVVGIFASWFDYFTVQNVSNVFSIASVVVGGGALMYHRIMRVRRKEHAESLKAEHDSEFMLLEHNQKLLKTIMEMQLGMIAKAAGKPISKDAQPCQESEQEAQVSS